jgi:hypothetical protein
LKQITYYLAGGALVAAVIIATSNTPDALPLVTMEAQGNCARLVINTDGQFRVLGSNDGVTWTVIEALWDTASYGKTLLIDHQNTGFALFKARPL